MIPSSGIQLDYPEIEEIYARFSGLLALGAGPGGMLLFYRDLDSAGLATAMAANVAGVASLGIEADAAVARQTLRAGVCDFVVNSLDEALRILKNEVRQTRAASVVLTGEVNAVVAEIVARGVQPDVVTFSVPLLIDRGAKLMSLDAGGDSGFTLSVTWEVQREASLWLPRLDNMVSGILGLQREGTRDSRVRWVEVSPRYLGRTYTGQRYVRMTSDEANRFLAAVNAAVKGGEIQVAVQVEVNGKAQLIES